jgi:hypothetical protein
VTCAEKLHSPHREAILASTTKPSSVSLTTTLLSSFSSDPSNAAEFSPLELAIISKFSDNWDGRKGHAYGFYNFHRRRSQMALFDPCLNSAAPICAYAILLFESHKHDHGMATRYLTPYLAAAQTCLRENSVADLTYASYLVAAFSLLTSTHEESIFRCDQFALACRHRFQSRATKEEKWWLEMLWHEIVRGLYFAHQDEVAATAGTELAPFSREAWFHAMDKFFQNSIFLIPTKAEMDQLPESIPSIEVLCLKIETLSRHLQFRLDYYLSERELKGPKSASAIRLKTELQSIVAKLTTAIIHLPNIGDVIYEAYKQAELLLTSVDISLPRPFDFLPDITLRGVRIKDRPRERDAAIALLYFFCSLVSSLLDDPAPDLAGKISKEPFIASLAICRICAATRTAMEEQITFIPSLNIMINYVMKRNLFWAGLVLSASTFYYGTNPILDVTSFRMHFTEIIF